MKNKLFIKKLPKGITETKIVEFLATIGKPKKISIFSNNEFVKTEFYALVEMNSPEEAQKVIETFNGKELDGQMVVITEANPIN